MTTLEALKFTAQIQIGSRLKGGGQIMIVTKITDKAIYGNSEYCLKKFNKEQEQILFFETILNPHYNKNLTILS